MNKKSKRNTVIVVAFALFAMFLGAANIIFPPYLGAMAGSSWALACLAFIITGTGLPLLGILATAKVDGKADAIGQRVSPGFSKILNILLIIFIGPLFAVPRTAATTIELSVIPFMPSDWSPKAVLIIGSLLFFFICLYFVLSPGNVIDRIGTYLTPVLVVFLLILLVISVVKPIGVPIEPTGSIQESGIFREGFTTGYQTMDALASIIFCATIFTSITNKGYTKEQARGMMLPIALISGVGTSIVYAGYVWIGASASGKLQGITEHTTLTVSSVQLLAGTAGRVILAMIIFLACCTTATGLIVTATEYFHTLFNQKVSYKLLAFIITGISYGISIIGVGGIIYIASPLLEVMYPVVIILIVLNLLGDWVKYDYAFHGALLAAAPVIVLNVMNMFDPTKPMSTRYLIYFPLGKEGFGAFVPAIVGAVLGSLLGFVLERNKKLSKEPLGKIK